MKLVLKLVAGLFVLVLLGLGSLLLLVDPNDFKPELQQLAREQGQVELQLAGDIGWSLYPSIALSLPALEVLTLEGKPLASLQRASVSVKVLPLLSGQLQMKGLLLDGLQLDWTVPAQAAAAGITQDPAGTQTDQTLSPPQTGDNAMAGDAQASAPTFNIGSIELINAQIRYADPVSAQVVELRDLNLSAQQLISGQAFPASVRFELALFQGAAAQPQLVAATELQTQLLIDLAQQRFAATGLQLNVALSGAALSDAGLTKPLPLQLGADLLVEQAADRAEIAGLTLVLANLALEADIQVESMTVQPQLGGRLKLAAFDLKRLLAELGLPAVVTQDDDALRRVAMQAVLTGTESAIGLEQLLLTLDQSRIEGALGYPLTNGAQRLQLELDAIDLDRYLPPPTESAMNESDKNQATASASAPRYSKAPLLPVELLRTLNLEADVGVGALTASGLSMQQLKLLVSAHNGLIELKQASGQLYQGSFNNSVTIDARRQPLILTAEKTVTGIELGALLVDLTELDRFSGLFSMQGRYQAQGNSIYDIVHSVDGDMQLELKQGRLKGVDLGDTLCRGILKLKGQQLPPETEQAYTEFSNLNATAKITDGVIVNRDLKAALTGISLAGDGQVNLPDETLNYGLSLAVLQEFASDNCRIDQQLHNLALPLRCQGGFDTDPAELCGVDTQRIKQVIGKATTQQAKQKLQQKLEDKLKDNDSVKSVLKGLFQ